MKTCITWKGSPMINIGNAEVLGWEAAIRGMRNPLNSWEKSDSGYCMDTIACHMCMCNRNLCKKNMDSHAYVVGINDYKLMKKLAKAGTDHRKFMRMITVYVDITAPLYWWKEFDTYKVGTVANSCSTMHKIMEKRFSRESFSCEHISNTLDKPGSDVDMSTHHWMVILDNVISALNVARERYFETEDKRYWWQIIQLLPSSYNQKRTVMLNYEVLANMYGSRKDHKLDEWRYFCKWVEKLPYSELITGEDRKLEYADQPGLALGA